MQGCLPKQSTYSSMVGGGRFGRYRLDHMKMKQRLFLDQRKVKFDWRTTKRSSPYPRGYRNACIPWRCIPYTLDTYLCHKYSALDPARFRSNYYTIILSSSTFEHRLLKSTTTKTTDITTTATTPKDDGLFASNYLYYTWYHFSKEK